MKNFVYTFAFVCCFAGTALAQSGIDERVSTVTRDMAAKMSLNESDYIRLKALNRDRYMKASEISSMYSNDISMRNMKYNELQNSYESQLQSFLNPKQIEAYTAYKKANTSFTAFTPEETK